MVITFDLGRSILINTNIIYFIKVSPDGLKSLRV